MTIEMQNKLLAQSRIIRKSMLNTTVDQLALESEDDIDTAYYPENFGGIYLDKQKLHVCFTDCSNKDLSAFLSLVDTNCVEFEKCKFSLGYLRSLNDSIKKALIDPLHYGIAAYCISEKENKIVFDIVPDAKESAIYDFVLAQGGATDAISFAHVDDYAKPTAVYARPGDRVYRWNSSRGVSVGTIGFNAKRKSDSVKGFVTADHILWAGYSIGNYEYQCSELSSYDRSATYDTCFVPLNSALSVSAIINNSSLYDSKSHSITGAISSSDLTTGLEVTGFGKTSGIYTGTVSSTSATTNITNTYTEETISVSGCVKVKTSSATIPADGDSGGPLVYVTESGSSTDKVKLIGTCTSSASYTSGGYSYAYYPRVSYALSALGLSLYVSST